MASLYGIEYRVLFVFPRLTRILSPLHVIVYSPHPIPRLPHSYRRLPETKKRLDKKTLASRCSDAISANPAHIALLFCVLQDRVEPYFQLLPVSIARINYSTPWPPDESTIETFESSQSPKLFSFPTPYSDPSRHALLRHPRRRQLLHPSDSGSRPQTKRRPRMRHLWVRRTAHDQTVPSLWWLRTSLICLFVPCDP